MMLARYLRTHYQTMENENMVPFSQELDNIRCYVALEQQVLGGRLNVVIDAPEKGFRVPGLSIETLAENAIRHGINRKQGKGTLEIRTGLEDGYYRITVKDDGTGFDPATISMEGSDHIGLHNAVTRLTRQCGAKVNVNSSPGNGCLVEILIPGENVK